SGFWKAYPPYARLGLDFVSLANPRWFASDPELAWGFYGHRLMLYRETEPHQGFAILRRWMSRMSGRGFVYTSNVDGHFQKAGFSPDQVYEVHGSMGALRRHGKAQYPHVRRLGLELIPRGNPAAKVKVLAGLACGGSARGGRVRRRHRDSYRAARLPGHCSPLRRDPDPDQSPRARSPGGSDLLANGSLRCTPGSRRANRLLDAAMITPR